MPITTYTIKELKKKGKKITALTAYDYPTAKLLDSCGIEIILVGDSLAQVVLGLDSTLQVTMDEMLHHAKAVIRGVNNALVVVDMPFLSYQISTEETIRNAGRFMQSGANAVKLEGASKNIIESIKRLTESGIPVMGHLGFTPQSVNNLGGNRIQSKTAKEANNLFKDAQLLEDAGCFAIVLEMIPQEVAQKITTYLSIPTIGIGAGINCDGQILVTDDLLGRFNDFVPSFVRKYAELYTISEEAIKKYINDVNSKQFPSDTESFVMNENELEKLEKLK